MSVRPKYRGLNIGKYLINLIQNKNYVGNFDAIVTSSDLDAIKFYEKYGFNIDPILNSKYKFIGDIWTNTTKMCYIPPYCQLIDRHQMKLREAFGSSNNELIIPIESSDTKSKVASETDPASSHEFFNYENICVQELTNMENDFKRWQKLMFSAYQSQAQIFFKLKQEITNLKIKLSAKESIIDDLKIQNNLLAKKNNLLKMELGKSLDIDIDFETHRRRLSMNESDELTTSNIDLKNATEDKQKKEEDNDLDKLIADLKVLSKAKHY
jgi:hypothetical protein